MKHSRSSVCAAAVLGLAVGGLAAPAVADPPLPRYTEWMSDDGGSAGRELPAISDDGRYVVFVGRSSAYQGVWIKDRDSDALATRVTTDRAFNPAISADGTTIAWAVYGGGEGGQNIKLLKWQQAGATPVTVSVGDDGHTAGAPTDFPSLNHDGTVVAFQSMDKDLDDDVMPGKTGGGPMKVYVRDLLANGGAGETEMVSVVDAEGGDQIVNGNAVKPDITPDGRFVAFASDASALQGLDEEEGGHSDLVAAEKPENPGEDEGEEEEESFQQVYLRDRDSQTTYPVSLASDGVSFGDGGSSTTYGPTVSDDGTKVAFESDAANLVAGDTNGDTDAFVRYMPGEVEASAVTVGVTVRVSLDHDGAQVDIPDGDAEATIAAMPEDPGSGGGGDEGEGSDATPNVGQGPVISGGGEFVAFESGAALTLDDLNGGPATCTDPQGTLIEFVEPADIYKVELGDGELEQGTLIRESQANEVNGAFEATGFRIDGMTGLCKPVNNGVDPAISLSGEDVVFVSNGNLTGRLISEEDDEGGGHETVIPLAEEESTTATEPTVFLRRPGKPGDEFDPFSQVKVERYDAGVLTLSYTTGTVTPTKVELWVIKPGATTPELIATDEDTIDGLFTYPLSDPEGKYVFYTKAFGEDDAEEEPAPGKYRGYTHDKTAPTTQASAPATSYTSSWTVTYAAGDGSEGSGVAKVELFVKKPGDTGYSEFAEDVGSGIDNKFTFTTTTGLGSYSFYTIGTDQAGNVEAAPASPDAVTSYTTPPPPPAGSDVTAPVSSASAPAVSTAASWEVTYTATDNSSGVGKVELFVKLPGAAAYTSVGVDTTSLDGKFAFASGGVEGDYAFYTVATDKSGNVEAAPATPDAVTEYTKPGPVVTDVTAPVSKAVSPRFARHDSFKVRYVARDEKAGSGLAKVELFVKTPGAASYTKVATDAGAGIDKVFGYTAAGEGVYRFYTVATDLAGNVEATPAKADTVTTVDKTPALAKRRMGKGPFVLDLGDRDRLMLRLRISERSMVSFLIRHEGELVKQFGPRWAGKGLVTRYWNGTDLDKKPCEPGVYVLVMKVKDMAGNTTLLRTRIHVVS